MSVQDSTSTGSDSVGAPSAHRRRRQACDRCFRRKQKCDRGLPACSACAELNIECKARQWAFLDGSAPDALVINASVSEYVKSLEDKLASPPRTDPSELVTSPTSVKRRRMTQGSATGPSPASMIDPALSSLATDHVASLPGTSPLNGVGQGGSRQPSLNGHNTGTPEGVRNGSVSVRDTMGDISFLSRSAMAESRVKDDTFPKNLSLDNMLSAATALGGSDPARSVPLMAAAKQQNRMSQYKPTLDRESTQQYLDHFIHNVAIKHLYLEKSDILEDYNTVLSDEGLCHGNVTPQSTFAYFNTCLAIAIGVLSSDDAAELSAFATSLYSAAVSHLPTILEIHGTLAIVHCMLTLAIYSLKCNSGGSTWHILGLIMNQCITLGLHKEPDSEDVSEHDQQRRRNLFWSTYVLDRSVSIIMGRPFGIQDEEITIKTFVAVEPPVQEPVETSFKLYLLQYAKLVSDIQSNQTRTPLFHYRNLYFWREAPAAVANLALANSYANEHIETLTCRALVLLIRPESSGASEGASLPSSTSPQSIRSSSFYNETAYAELETEAMICCKRFIDRNYEQSESRGRPSDVSFSNAYDLFAACIAFVYLARRGRGRSLMMNGNNNNNNSNNGDTVGSSTSSTQLPPPPPTSSSMVSASSFSSASAQHVEAARVIIQKCSTLITILSQQFASLRLFQRALLALSARLSDPNVPLPIEDLASVVPQHVFVLAEMCA